MNDVVHHVRHFARRRPRTAVAVAAGAAALLLVIALLITERYPIMVVNGTVITARRFEKNFYSAAVYHNNLLKSSAENATATAALARLTQADLGVGVLDQLVSAVLVDRGARREAGSDLDALVHGKIDEYVSDPTIQRGVQTLYGMGYADFKDEVLVPQAERDILAGRLFLRGQDVDAWMQEERQKANVLIFSSRFRWDGEKVVAQ